VAQIQLLGEHLWFMSLKMIWGKVAMSSASLLEMLVEDWHVVLLA